MKEKGITAEEEEEGRGRRRKKRSTKEEQTATALLNLTRLSVWLYYKKNPMIST